MPGNALIVYGTRFGATAGTSEEIGNVIRNEGYNVKVANLKKEKINNILEYNLVIVGSGMMIGRWTGEPEKFLKKFQKELSGKKLAIFVSSAAKSLMEHEGKIEELEKTTKQYLNEKADKYGLHPVAMRIFGGVWDYNTKPWWSGKALDAIKLQLEKAGLKETKPGIYDTRDWDDIRKWAKDLAK